MKRLQAATLIIFASTLCIFAWFYFDEKSHTDSSMPSIQVSSGILNISIHDGTDALLSGVTAFDAADGDLTESVLIESISPFAEDGTCTVTYAVADSDDHVAKASRKIRYTDYTPPRFALNQALVVPTGTILRVSTLIRAEDCIDGDLSDKILLTATNYQASTAGVFYLSFQVSNSKGDLAELELPIYVENQDSRAPVIQLSEYLVYVPKGTTPDFASYIESVTSEYSTLAEDVLISSDYQPDVPGVYSIHYRAWDAQGREDHTVLTVVVEE